MRKIYRLAIVIPAYKPDYLFNTLQSIYSQSCKDFNLYIGDDCSPYDLKQIIDKFDDGLVQQVYKRFETNLGGKDLVAQWERCIALTQGEDWIWLFSDDDVMGEKCVENFYKELDRTRCAYDLYHFNVKVIDGNGHVLGDSVYQDVMHVESFYKLKAMAKIESFVVENVFSRKIYDQVGGFSKFPLAWGSDTFTWMLMMKDKGMKTVPDDYVYWRSSGVNITPNRNREISIVKAMSDIELMRRTGILLGKSIRGFNVRYFFRMLVHYCDDIGYDGFKILIKKAFEQKTINRYVSFFSYASYPICKLIKHIR